MKYIKKFENSENINLDILEIKDILLSLKDEYIGITGEIYPWNPPSISEKLSGITLLIDTYKIRPNHTQFSIKYSEMKLNLIKSILDTLKQIEKALNAKCRVINIWDCYTENKIQINIFNSKIENTN
mgnify:CR=1 FL=1